MRVVASLQFNFQSDRGPDGVSIPNIWSCVGLCSAWIKFSASHSTSRFSFFRLPEYAERRKKRKNKNSKKQESVNTRFIYFPHIFFLLHHFLFFLLTLSFL